MNIAHPLKISLVIALATFATTTWAQTIYRSVAPDGKVIYSDKPLPVQPEAKPLRKPDDADGRATKENSDANSSTTLPYELRQVAARFPVTLYTSPECTPCTEARALLRTRGVPYTERTINSADDSKALQNIAGNTALPFMTVGSQHMSGYSETDWDLTLDLAGYPKNSKLPRGFQTGQASPLTNASSKSSDKTPAAPVPYTTAPAAPDVPTPSNPAGIRF